jgi:hypothetical protein
LGDTSPDRVTTWSSRPANSRRSGNSSRRCGMGRNDFQVGRPCETPRVCLKLSTPCPRRSQRACSIGELQRARWPHCSK